MKGYEDSSYGNAFADVYDDWYEQVSDVEGTIGVLRTLGGDGPFLELGVGTGRLALALAQTGADVTGIDSSSQMLDRLRTKSTARHAAIKIIQGDMVADLPPTLFKVIYVVYNTIFGLPSYERQQQLFQAVATRLQPTGYFLLEAAVPDPQRPSGSTIGLRSMQADRVVLSIDTHDPQNQQVDGQFVEFTESGGVRLRPWSIRYSYPSELDTMATTCGLTLRHRWANVTQEPFDGQSENHVSVYST